MSGRSSSSAKGDPPPKAWNLPPELEREALVYKKCEEGKYIVCRTCNKHNPETTEREEKDRFLCASHFGTTMLLKSRCRVNITA
jgi:hypothetical protein